MHLYYPSKKGILTSLCLSILVFCTACSDSKQVFEMSVEQIQARGISSYELTQHRDGFDETCGSETQTNNVTVYRFKLSENIPYQLKFSPTSLTCAPKSTVFDVRLFFFNQQGSLIARGETDESWTSRIRLTPETAGFYYLAVVPKYRNDSGGYALHLSEIQASKK